ncbi:MAG TPA: alpha/beta fold hydrolase, partial [Pseudobacter sp.]|nr:alpha/beta fold hydrolase [Pseudobacter sp.]
MNNQNSRRHFLRNAALSLSAVGLSLIGMGQTQVLVNNNSLMKHIQPLGPVKQINAGVLNIGYVDAGPANGQPVILLHGWPYDINSFAEVTPMLVAAGYRVIVPHLRGYGTTTFLDKNAVKNGQQSALAVDVIELMDALKIKKAVIGGFDWGARTANIVAALWPERVKAMVSVSGYLIGNQAAERILCLPQQSCNGGTSIISQQTGEEMDMHSTRMISINRSGNWHLHNGILMMLHSTFLQHLSKMLIT